jgi:hypothetical protein
MPWAINQDQAGKLICLIACYLAGNMILDKHDCIIYQYTVNPSPA